MILSLLAPLLAALAPLLLPLGRNFEYEYATLNAYAAIILIPILALWSPPALTWKKRGMILLLTPAINILPGLIFFAFAICPCSFGEFYSFWFIQSLPHILLGLALAAAIEAGRRQGYGRSRLLGLYLGALFLMLTHLALRLWLEPQKRTTHVLGGFLHGAIYDDWIPLDAGILWTRGAHSALALSLLTLIVLPRKLWRYPSAAALFAAFLYCQAQGVVWPSQSYGLHALAKLMPESRTGPGFTLHFARHQDDVFYDSRLEEFYQSASFHSQDLMRILDVPNPGVHIFVYPNRESKKLWFGGDGTDITDVVTPSIHITLDTWPHPTLRHELVHAIASRFAYHGLGFHPNMAFTEGLAVALAPMEEDMSLHEGAADIIQNKRLTEVERLFSPLFWSESGRRAYTIAGSLLLYLLDQGGLPKVKALYAGAGWESVFGRSASSTIHEWKAFLLKDYLRTGSSLNAEALFRYPGILQDLCPHSKATLSKSGQHFLLQARQPKGWNASRDYWPWRVSLEQDPGAELAMLQQRFKANQVGEEQQAFVQDLKKVLKRSPKIQEDVEIFLLHFDLLISQKQSDQARQEMEDFIKITQNLRISDSLTRQLWVRLLLLRESTLERSEGWFKLLAGRDQGVPLLLPPSPAWIEAYLFLRNKSAKDFTRSQWEKLRSQALPEGLPLTFKIEWWKILAGKSLQQGDLRQSKEMYTEAMKIAPEGSRASLRLLVEELDHRGNQMVKTPVH